MADVICPVFGRSSSLSGQRPPQLHAASALADQALQFINGQATPRSMSAFANDMRPPRPVHETGENQADFARRCAIHLCRERINLVRRAERLWMGDDKTARRDFARMNLIIPDEDNLIVDSSDPTRADVVCAALAHSARAIETLRTYQTDIIKPAQPVSAIGTSYRHSR